MTIFHKKLLRKTLQAIHISRMYHWYIHIDVCIIEIYGYIKNILQNNVWVFVHQSFLCLLKFVHILFWVLFWDHFQLYSHDQIWKLARNLLGDKYIAPYNSSTVPWNIPDISIIMLLADNYQNESEQRINCIEVPTFLLPSSKMVPFSSQYLVMTTGDCHCFVGGRGKEIQDIWCSRNTPHVYLAEIHST